MKIFYLKQMIKYIFDEIIQTLNVWFTLTGQKKGLYYFVVWSVQFCYRVCIIFVFLVTILYINVLNLTWKLITITNAPSNGFVD